MSLVEEVLRDETASKEGYTVGFPLGYVNFSVLYNFIHKLGHKSSNIDKSLDFL
jgi:hypothetical protein